MFVYWDVILATVLLLTKHLYIRQATSIAVLKKGSELQYEFVFNTIHAYIDENC